jgi:Cu+-exporting ATPase
MLSGDNDAERENLNALFGAPVEMHFNQLPEDKLNHVDGLKKRGIKTMMVGDGLNDAGALKVADVGIAVTENVNNFSPGCDAILDAGNLFRLPDYIALARRSKQVVVFSFILSILYNLVGLTFAFQGLLSPLVAAVLMPSSSITIMLVTWLGVDMGKQRLNKKSLA